jgi:hypothetical protein
MPDCGADLSLSNPAEPFRQRLNTQKRDPTSAAQIVFDFLLYPGRFYMHFAKGFNHGPKVSFAKLSI